MAKLDPRGLEIVDQPVFELTEGMISGHTLKHLAAAAGAFAMSLKTYHAEKPGYS